MMFLLTLCLAIVAGVVGTTCWIQPPSTDMTSVQGGLVTQEYTGTTCAVSKQFNYDLRTVGPCMKQTGVHAGKWGKNNVGTYTNPTTSITKKGIFKYIYLDAACTQPDPTQTGSPNCNGCNTCPDPVNNDDIKWTETGCVSTSNGNSKTVGYASMLGGVPANAYPSTFSSFIQYANQASCASQAKDQIRQISGFAAGCTPQGSSSGFQKLTCTSSGDGLTLYTYTDNTCSSGRTLAYDFPDSMFPATCDNQVGISQMGYARVNCIFKDDTCPSGSVSKGSACETCLAGTAPNSDKTSCISCAEGKFSTTGSDVCSTCSAGEYSTADSSECTNCSAGTSSIAGSKCVICPAGKSAISGAVCVDCSKNTISASAGASSCKTCNSGFVTTGTGATACTKDTGGGGKSPKAIESSSGSGAAVGGGIGGALALGLLGFFIYRRRQNKDANDNDDEEVGGENKNKSVDVTHKNPLHDVNVNVNAVEMNTLSKMEENLEVELDNTTPSAPVSPPPTSRGVSSRGIVQGRGIPGRSPGRGSIRPMPRP